MLELYQVLGLIVIHWIADFIFQAERWAVGKSKNIISLLSHTVMYTIMFMILLFSLELIFTEVQPFTLLSEFPFISITDNEFIIKIIHFGSITFVLHTITDYITSKVVSRMFEKKKYYTSIPSFGAFSIIGFDQVLHYVQLFLTYILVFQYVK